MMLYATWIELHVLLTHLSISAAPTQLCGALSFIAAEATSGGGVIDTTGLADDKNSRGPLRDLMASFPAL